MYAETDQAGAVHGFHLLPAQQAVIIQQQAAVQRKQPVQCRHDAGAQGGAAAFEVLDRSQVGWLKQTALQQFLCLPAPDIRDDPACPGLLQQKIQLVEPQKTTAADPVHGQENGGRYLQALQEREGHGGIVPEPVVKGDQQGALWQGLLLLDGRFKLFQADRLIVAFQEEQLFPETGYRKLRPERRWRAGRTDAVVHHHQQPVPVELPEEPVQPSPGGVPEAVLFQCVTYHSGPLRFRREQSGYGQAPGCRGGGSGLSSVRG